MFVQVVGERVVDEEDEKPTRADVHCWPASALDLAVLFAVVLLLLLPCFAATASGFFFLAISSPRTS